MSPVEPGCLPARTFVAERLTRPWRSIAVAFLFAVVCACAVVMQSEPSRHEAMGLSVLLGMSVALAMLSVLRPVGRPRARRVQLYPTSTALRVNGTRWRPTAKVVSAFVARTPAGAVVTLQQRWRAHCFRFPTLDEGEAFLVALALTPAQRVMVFAIGLTPVTTIIVVPFAISITVWLALLARFTSVPYFTVLLTPLLTYALSGFRSITIGRDGIGLQTGLKRTFLPFGEIDAVERQRETLVIARSNRALRLPVNPRKNIETGHNASEIVTFAIQAALAAWKERAATQSAAHAAPIVGASDGGAARYRVSAVPRERLLDLVEDPTAEPKIRVAAVEALGADGDDDMRARLDQVAATTASPDLRRALSAATKR